MSGLPHASMRVLVVQDDAISRELIAHLLRMSGYEPLAADTGESGFTTIRRWRGRIDCLFSTIRLPGLIDGWIVGDEFRRLNPNRPILYVSDGSVGLRSNIPGAIYLQAPASPLEVLERIKGLTRLAGEAAPPACSEPERALLAS